MTHSEYLNLMVNLEIAINELTKALDEELDGRGNGLNDTGKWLAAFEAVNLAKGMTATKCAISTMHHIAYGDK